MNNNIYKPWNQMATRRVPQSHHERESESIMRHHDIHSYQWHSIVGGEVHAHCTFRRVLLYSIGFYSCFLTTFCHPRQLLLLI